MVKERVWELNDWVNMYLEVCKNGIKVPWQYNSPSVLQSNVDHWDMGKLDRQRHFFERMTHQLGYKCMEDWYKVTQDDIGKTGGGTLLSPYNNSPSLALQNIF